MCEGFTGKFCASILASENRTLVSRNCSVSFMEADERLTRMWLAIKSVYHADSDCIDPARWLLCITMFPECNAARPVTRLPCREACTAVYEDLCKKEWSTIESMRDILASEIIVPSCQIFPSQKEAACIYPAAVSDALRRKNGGPFPSFNFLVAGSVGGSILVASLAIGVLCCRVYRRKAVRRGRTLSLAEIKEVHRQPHVDHITKDVGATGPMQETVAEFAKSVGLKVFPRENLFFIEDLGEGAFGKVVKCKAQGLVDSESTTVTAVKCLKESSDTSIDTVVYFRKEVETLSLLNHPNVIKLLGICTNKDGPMCLILEYMDLGDLNKFLRDRSGSYHAVAGGDGLLPEGVNFLPPELSTRSLLSVAKQVAEGLSYLSGKRFVHRDIATRNCLVDSKVRVKISDFGLSHDVYGSDYYRVHSQKVLPLRWLPPEALTLGKFTIYSDIWSYGILLWEIMTYGTQPFLGLSNEEVCNRIRCHKLLEIPYGCPTQIYELMRSCWRFEPSHRNSCQNIATTIDGWLEESDSFIDESWLSLQRPPINLKRAIDGRRRKRRYEYKRSEITI